MKTKKPRKKMRKFNGEWKLTGRKNRHHDLNVCRFGTNEPRNIYHWDTACHAAWHFLFRNMTILEVSEWLKKMHEYKQQGIELQMGG